MSVISSNDRRIQHTASGGDSSFSYDFRIDDADHLNVYRDGVLLARTTDYTVTGVGSASGGTIVPVDGLTIVAGEIWIIDGATPQTRSRDYSSFSQIEPSAIDADVDQLIFMAQQQRRDMSLFENSAVERWDPGQAYTPSSMLRRNGKVYRSRTDNEDTDPATDDGTNWRRFLDAAQAIYPLVDLSAFTIASPYKLRVGEVGYLPKQDMPIKIPVEVVDESIYRMHVEVRDGPVDNSLLVVNLNPNNASFTGEMGYVVSRIDQGGNQNTLTAVSSNLMPIIVGQGHGGAVATIFYSTSGAKKYVLSDYESIREDAANNFNRGYAGIEWNNTSDAWTTIGALTGWGGSGTEVTVMVERLR